MTMETAVEAAGGRRESNKRDKLTRIRKAARTVFTKKGFERATAKDIAASAGVAFGTLFLYANGKHELLLLIFDEEFEPLIARATEHVDPAAPLSDQLIGFFGEFYRYFCKTPDLSRQMMKEMTFSEGMVATRIRNGVQKTEQRVTEIVAEAQRRGLINKKTPPEIAARIFFSLYRMEIRLCLAAAEPDVKSGLRKLRQQFEIVCAGLR